MLSVFPNHETKLGRSDSMKSRDGLATMLWHLLLAAFLHPMGVAIQQTNISTPSTFRVAWLDRNIWGPPVHGRSLTGGMNNLTDVIL
ncbi:MAG: hypothetical protein ONB44_03840 [candidate division KSB1 bacterium]|nr:hypothetical protein [candidate division KSB1 bacterium]